MFFKVGEIRPYVYKKIIHFGKILKVDEKNNTYEIEDLETKEVNTLIENDVFIGDD